MRKGDVVRLFSRGHATLHLAVSVRRSVTFLNSERFSHRPCQPVRDWIAVYPALFDWILGSEGVGRGSSTVIEKVIS